MKLPRKLVMSAAPDVFHYSNHATLIGGSSPPLHDVSALAVCTVELVLKDYDVVYIQRGPKSSFAIIIDFDLCTETTSL